MQILKVLTIILVFIFLAFLISNKLKIRMLKPIEFRDGCT